MTDHASGPTSEEAIRVMQGDIWMTRRGYRIQVINTMRHADCCTVEFVFYQNLDPTFDAPPGANWVLSKAVFVERFSKVTEDGTLAPAVRS